MEGNVQRRCGGRKGVGRTLSEGVEKHMRDM